MPPTFRTLAALLAASVVGLPMNAELGDPVPTRETTGHGPMPARRARSMRSNDRRCCDNRVRRWRRARDAARRARRQQRRK